LKLTGGDDSKTLLLYVGRLGAEKNLKVIQQVRVFNSCSLIEVCHLKILRNVSNTRLVFVGDGPYESELKQYFQDDDVLFAGKKEGKELSEIFASCDIFVMPSETETLGFVVLEAMASGYELPPSHLK
jgi:sulfoquinovosyltransferase